MIPFRPTLRYPAMKRFVFTAFRKEKMVVIYNMQDAMVIMITIPTVFIRRLRCTIIRTRSAGIYSNMGIRCRKISALRRMERSTGYCIIKRCVHR